LYWQKKRLVCYPIEIVDAEPSTISQEANVTNELLGFAMEESGVGLTKGTMNLDSPDGVRAFMRSIEAYFPYPICHCSTIGAEKTCMNIQNQEVSSSGTGSEQLHLDLKQKMAVQDDKFTICKATINPFVLFLHVDQGHDDQTYYTPMASLIANARSLITEHVDTVCEAIKKEEYTVIGKEDMAVSTYYVKVKEAMSDDPQNVLQNPNGGEHPIKSKCILNHDRHTCNGEVMTKQAVALEVDTILDTYNKVSTCIICHMTTTTHLFIADKKNGKTHFPLKTIVVLFYHLGSRSLGYNLIGNHSWEDLYVKSLPNTTSTLTLG
jgi:hypothetical protein